MEEVQSIFGYLIEVFRSVIDFNVLMREYRKYMKKLEHTLYIRGKRAVGEKCMDVIMEALAVQHIRHGVPHPKVSRRGRETTYTGSQRVGAYSALAFFRDWKP
jgi:hypothetical protein